MLANASLSWETSLLLTGAGGGGIGANGNCWPKEKKQKNILTLTLWFKILGAENTKFNKRSNFHGGHSSLNVIASAVNYLYRVLTDTKSWNTMYIFRLLKTYCIVKTLQSDVTGLTPSLFVVVDYSLCYTFLKRRLVVTMANTLFPLWNMQGIIVVVCDNMHLKMSWVHYATTNND